MRKDMYPTITRADRYKVLKEERMLDLPVDWNDPTPTRTTHAPYHVQRTPRGSVVICARHVITDEVKHEEARALAIALNQEFQRSTQG